MPKDENDPPERVPISRCECGNEYRLFPDEIEDDAHIFFHGTAATNLESILKDGFKIPDTLPSVSFARQSSLPLRYACAARSQASPKGCVLAVQFDDVHRPGIKSESFGIHVYSFDEQPRVLGYCFVPEDYKFN